MIVEEMEFEGKTVVRSRISGVAVEFNIDPRKEAHLLAAVQQVLSNYPIDE